MNYLRFSPPEYRAMTRVYRELALVRENLTAFGCLLSFELNDTWPGLARRIDGFSDGELRLLRERMQGHPDSGLTAAELRTLAEAWGPLPLTGRFVRPLRRHLVVWLMRGYPKLARKVARLSDDAFERLCGQLQGRREGTA